jgi:transposase
MAADGGLEALAVKKAPGAIPKLTPKQLDQLVRWLVGSDPRQLQFDFALWTREMVRVLIERKFGVSYTPQGVGNLLRRLGFSPQRPLVRAHEQDPERVAAWRASEYPRIRALADQQGATILFGDEAGVRSDFHAGTTWAPVGQTPVVTGTGNRVSLNMISAVSPRGQLYFKFLDGPGNSQAFIGFLRDLLHDIDGKIFLIVDGHSAHLSKATKKFVADTGGRLSLFFLPPYSPELNPDEWVWKNIKHDNVGRLASRTKQEMRDGIDRAVRRLRETPSIILGFFRDPDLAYINA